MKAGEFIPERIIIIILNAILQGTGTRLLTHVGTVDWRNVSTPQTGKAVNGVWPSVVQAWLLHCVYNINNRKNICKIFRSILITQIKTITVMVVLLLTSCKLFKHQEINFLIQQKAANIHFFCQTMHNGFLQ